MQDPILTPIFTGAIVGTFGIGAASFTFGSTGIGLASLLSTATLLAGSLALSYALQPSAQRTPDGNQSIKQRIPVRYAGFGRDRVTPAYMAYEVGPDDISYDVLAFVQGPVCRIVQDYLHDDAVEYVDPDNPEEVTAGTDGRYGGAAVRIYNRMGLPTETAYSRMLTDMPTIWTEDHRGDGIASALLTCGSVEDTDFLRIYPNGLPQLSRVFDLPALWDFRDPAQDPDDPATWTDYPAFDIGSTYAAGTRLLFKGVVVIVREDGTTGLTPDDTPAAFKFPFRNNVLQACKYLTDPVNGCGLPRAVLIDPAIAALTVQADVCDELVETKNGDGESRYQSGMTYALDEDEAATLGSLLASCDGWVGRNRDGSLAMVVGKYIPPDDDRLTLTADHIMSVDLAYGKADAERIDELTLAFASPDHAYKIIDGQPWRHEDAITTRGKTRSQPFAPKGVQSHSQLRRLAKRLDARLNTPLRGVLTTSLFGATAAGRRWVKVKYPKVPELADAVIEVWPKLVKDLAAGKVTIEFNVIDPETIDAWDAATEEGEPPRTPIKLNRESLPVPQNVEAVTGGSPPFHIDVSWDDITSRIDLGFRVRYALTDNGAGDQGPWSYRDFFAPSVDAGRAMVTLFPTTDDEYVLQVASRKGDSISEWSQPPTFITLSDDILREDGTFMRREDETHLLRETA